MTDDLIERLRAVTEDDAYAHPWTFGEVCRNGADEIKRLRAEIARLSAALAAQAPATPSDTAFVQPARSGMCPTCGAGHTGACSASSAKLDADATFAEELTRVTATLWDKLTEESRQPLAATPSDGEGGE